MVLANKSGRVALVTGGSIVTFKELINEVITPGFLDTLAHHGFTALILQCGDYVHEVDKKVAQLGHVKIEIRTFAWDSNLLETMKLCRGEAGGRPAGVVISHAGELSPHSLPHHHGAALPCAQHGPSLTVFP